MNKFVLTENEKAFHKEIHDSACRTHRDKYCRYSGHDYSLHLDSALHVGKQFINLLNDNQLNVLCAISCHDIIEDCGVNYNDLIVTLESKSVLHQGMLTKADTIFIADCVYNVTNELGRNRKERAEKTYPKIAACEYATFVKLCDRIANMRFGWLKGGDMLHKYKKEHAHFYEILGANYAHFQPMWKELEYMSNM